MPGCHIRKVCKQLSLAQQRAELAIHVHIAQLLVYLVPRLNSFLAHVRAPMTGAAGSVRICIADDRYCDQPEPSSEREGHAGITGRHGTEGTATSWTRQGRQWSLLTGSSPLARLGDSAANPAVCCPRMNEGCYTDGRRCDWLRMSTWGSAWRQWLKLWRQLYQLAACEGEFAHGSDEVVLLAGPVWVTVVSQECTPIDITVLITGDHDTIGAPEIDVVVAIRETGVSTVFEPDLIELLASQGCNCGKMYLSEVLQPRRCGFPLGALQNEYAYVRDADGGCAASVADIWPWSSDLCESAPDLIIGLTAIFYPSFE